MPNQNVNILNNSNSLIVKQEWTMSKLKTLLQNPNFNAIVPKLQMMSGENSPIMKQNMGSRNGRIVTWEVEGELTGNSSYRREQGVGRGVGHASYSETTTYNQFQFVKNNGYDFDAKTIGSTMYMQSLVKASEKLLGWYGRNRDQLVLDALAGNLTYADVSSIGRGDITYQTQFPTHRKVFSGATFGRTELLNLSKTLKTNKGWTTGGSNRAFIKPSIIKNGKACYYLLVTTEVYHKLLGDTDFTNLLTNADKRGQKENAVFTNEFSMFDNLMIINVADFNGKFSSSSDGNGAGWGINDINVEQPGLRAFQHKTANTFNAGDDSVVNSDNIVWSGMEGFDIDNEDKDTYSRCLLVGANSLIQTLGKPPTIMTQYSHDFQKTSDTALFHEIDLKKTRYKIETGEDYENMKFANIDIGVVPIDIKH